MGEDDQVYSGDGVYTTSNQNRSDNYQRVSYTPLSSSVIIPSSGPESPHKHTHLASIFLFAFFTAVVGAATYFSLTYLGGNAPSSRAKESAILDKQVSAFFDLPDEAPKVVTLLDLKEVESQDFFENAELGDKVLIYFNGKKAVLFRPSTGKVIEVADIEE